MEIHYCELCSGRVADTELQDGRAARTGSGVVCEACCRAHGIQKDDAPRGPSATKRTRFPRLRRVAARTAVRTGTVTFLVAAAIGFLVALVAASSMRTEETPRSAGTPVQPPPPPVHRHGPLKERGQTRQGLHAPEHGFRVEAPPKRTPLSEVEAELERAHAAPTSETNPVAEVPQVNLPGVEEGKSREVSRGPPTPETVPAAATPRERTSPTVSAAFAAPPQPPVSRPARRRFESKDPAVNLLRRKRGIRTEGEMRIFLPADAASSREAALALTLFDWDQHGEGEIYVNGHRVKLQVSKRSNWRDYDFPPVAVPLGWLKFGPEANVLRFVCKNKVGFKVTQAAILVTAGAGRSP